MFQANSQNIYIPSKSQNVKPDVVSDVSGNDQIRISIPSFIGFVDPNETYFKCNLKINNPRGIVVPDKKGGIHALFRNVMIRDGSNTTQIESLEDYNAESCMVRPFLMGSSDLHSAELFEGVQDIDNRDGSSLYYGAPNSLSSSDTTARTTNTIQIYTKLRSGFMNGGIIPVSMLNGLRITIDTEDPLRCLRLSNTEASSELSDKTWKVNTDQTVGLVGNRDGTGAANLGSIVLNKDTDDAGSGNPFAIGDKLYINDTVATGEETLGVIQGFTNAGSKLQIDLILQADTGVNVPSANYTTANGSYVYYKISDREKALNTLGASAAGNVADTVIPTVSYTLSDIEMLCQSVQPPDGYVEGMLKKASGDEGVSIDFMTRELHRFNQSNTEGVVQVQIPTLSKRAKAVFCQPIPSQSYRGLNESSLSGVSDNARNYQFVKGTELIPSRNVNLERYSIALASSGQFMNEPLHTSELQKALANINKPAKNLQKIADSFCIARSFNKYGQITDLSDETLSLRVDYNSGAVQKVFNNYVYKLARLNVSKGIALVSS